MANFSLNVSFSDFIAMHSNYTTMSCEKWYKKLWKLLCVKKDFGLD